MTFREQIRRDEGLRLWPYQDATGHFSIGYGRNLTGKGITSGEAEMLLDHDIADAIADLQRALPWTWDLDEARRGVLLNMVFNLGIGDADEGTGLLGFRRMLEALQDGDYERAAAEILESRYAGQVGDRATRLAQQMRTGQWV